MVVDKVVLVLVSVEVEVLVSVVVFVSVLALSVLLVLLVDVVLVDGTVVNVIFTCVPLLRTSTTVVSQPVVPFEHFVVSIIAVPPGSSVLTITFNLI